VAVSDQTTLSSVRVQLTNERDRLRAQIDALLAGSPAGPAFDDNFADSGQVAAEQGENQALAGQLRDQLEEVERALGKIEQGTYGICEVCGTAIAPLRLEAMPSTRYCIDHA
jgi:RNA polymerase-binding transcription factor DksA